MHRVSKKELSGKIDMQMVPPSILKTLAQVNS